MRQNVPLITATSPRRNVWMEHDGKTFVIYSQLHRAGERKLIARYEDIALADENFHYIVENFRHFDGNRGYHDREPETGKAES